MKKTYRYKRRHYRRNNTRKTRTVLTVAFLASVALCLLIFFVANHKRNLIPRQPNDTAGVVTSDAAQADSAPPQTSVPEETVSETTPLPENLPTNTDEPVTTAEPEETDPVTTTEQEPEDVEEKEYIGEVYLTFDDGPSALTEGYLDVLKEYGVNATFFVLGFSDDNEWKIDVLKRAVDEGNQIGLHGYSHDYAQIYKSVDAATNNFFSENQLLHDVLGIDAKIIRFPGGVGNTISKHYCENVMTDSAKILTDNGYIYFDWNVSSSDAGDALHSSEDIFKNVIEGVHPSWTNIVLMHDGGGHEATLEALPQIIEWLLNEGYELKVITDETPVVRHPINN